MATIEERAKKAVREHYNCEYPCYNYRNCVFGSGSNTSYDCEECGADDFNEGYMKGATEQRRIDIEKAYHALENVVAKDILEELRKVMEE